MVIRPGDAGGHLDPLEVAEHAEDLLASDRASAVEAHLSSCARCRELAASIAGVSATLADAPRELPMPGGVAARIDAVLADEAAARSVPGRRPAAGFWSGLRGRLPAIAAAAASVAVLGLIGYSLAGEGGGDDADTATDAGADAAQSEESGDEAAEPPADGTDDGTGTLQGEEPPGEESDDLDADDDAAGGAQDDAESGDGEQAETFDAPPRELDALIGQLQDILTEQSTRAEPGEDGRACGTVLAEELGGELLGAAETDLVEPGSVLVAIDLDDPDTLSGWVLPDCTSSPDDVMADFTVPRPE